MNYKVRIYNKDFFNDVYDNFCRQFEEDFIEKSSENEIIVSGSVNKELLDNIVCTYSKEKYPSDIAYIYYGYENDKRVVLGGTFVETILTNREIIDDGKDLASTGNSNVPEVVREVISFTKNGETISEIINIYISAPYLLEEPILLEQVTRPLLDEKLEHLNENINFNWVTFDDARIKLLKEINNFSPDTATIMNNLSFIAILKARTPSNEEIEQEFKVICDEIGGLKAS